MASTIHNLVDINRTFNKDLNNICKLLQCVALLEERTGVNSPLFDLYRKVECKYCLSSFFAILLG